MWHSSGDLLASQPAGPSPLSAGQADVLGLQRLPAAAEELRQTGPIDHGPSSPAPERATRDRQAVDDSAVDQGLSVWVAGRVPAATRAAGAHMPGKPSTSPSPTSPVSAPWSRARVTASDWHRRSASRAPAPRSCCPSATEARAKRRWRRSVPRHPDGDARRWRPRPVLAGVGRRPRREAPHGRDADPPPRQQRRCHDAARAADHRRRLRAAARHQPPGPLRARPATCCRCCGPVTPG